MLAILKEGIPLQKAQLMYLMLQTDNMVMVEKVTEFARAINALQSDISIVHTYFMKIEGINMSEKEFINMFLKEHRKNSVFMWINELASPYKELEDAKANASTFSLSSMKAKVELPPELESLAEKKRLDRKVVRELYLSYLHLQKRDALKVSLLAESIMEYGIKDPLATLLVKKCTQGDELVLKKFVKVFYLLTQPNAAEERNKLIFAAYFQDQDPIKVYSSPHPSEHIQSLLSCCGVKPDKIAESIESLRRNFKEEISKQDCAMIAQDESAMNVGNVANLRHYPYLRLGFPAPSLNVQHRCVQFAVLPDDTLEKCVNRHLQTEKRFYLLNSVFWDTWRKFKSDEAMLVVDESNRLVSMNLPIEKGYSLKLASYLVYNDNFIIIPERVYILLRHWHGARCYPEVRKVIKYKEEKPPLYNPNELKAPEGEMNFKQKIGDYIYELEINLYFFLCFQVTEEGEFPGTQKASFWKLLPGTQPIVKKFREIYVSR